MTKSDISSALRDLEKAGYLVFTFNFNGPMPTGCKGWPDHVVIKDDKMYLIECKINQDRVRPAQKKLQYAISQYFDDVHYIIVTEKNWDEVLKRITEAK